MDSVRNTKAVVLVIAAGALCPFAFCLNPTLEINQYSHKAWTVRGGDIKGPVYAIAQTPDGYLWIGTEFGLARFDGLRTREWQPPVGDGLPGGRIRSLLAARDGRLWIGTDEGLASWKDGKLTHYKEAAGKYVLSIVQDHEGTVWAAVWGVGAKDGRILSIRDGHVESHGNDGALGIGIDGLYQDRGGTLWAGSTNGVWRWKPAPARFFPMPINTSSFAEGDRGELFIATIGGIRTLTHEEPGQYLVPAAGLQSKFGRLLRDRDGGLWAGTYDGGLSHVYQGKIDRFSQSDGLSGNGILSFFEDREGSIWVGTRDGLDRFREFAVPTITEKQGLSTSFVGSVLHARDGSTWLATLNGLDRWKDGKVAAVYGKKDGLPDPFVKHLFEDQTGRIWISADPGIVYFERGMFVPVPNLPGGSVTCIGGDGAGGVWISKQPTLLHLDGRTVLEEIPWSELGHNDYAVMILPDSTQGGLWLGFRQGGLVYYKDRSVRASYGREQGLGEGEVSDIKLDRDGTVWAATAGGLNLIRNGHTRRLSSANGLRCANVHWVLEDNDHFFWLGTACGVVRVARSELDRWFADPSRNVSITVFDNTDGVRSNITPMDGSPSAAQSADGKIWFLPKDGVSIIDPRHLPVNQLQPPVHIERIVADEKEHELRPGMRLPPNVHNLQIDYAALSLVAPEKIHFKYKLDGQDQGWTEVVNDRQAKYTNLRPGSYRFRVIASNDRGLWNETGDALEFSIAPAFRQTNWFRASWMAAFMALLWAAYQFRTKHLHRESKKLRDVIETIPAMAWTALPDGSNEFVNGRWTEYTGLSVDRTAGAGWAAAVHPEDRQQFGEKWRASIASGAPLESEARFRCAANGEYRWFHARGVPLCDRHGKIARWYGILTDIEDRKRAEQERERRRMLESELAHINRVSMMGELAASVAHEVNQPLTGIVSNGSAGLRMLSGATPDVEEARETFADIVRDGKRAGEVIARIRAMTKRAEIPRERLNVNDVIREVLVLVRDEAKKRNVDTQMQSADDLAPVFGDRVQLQQVVLNLVMNAMEAMSNVIDRPRQLTIYTSNIDGSQVEVMVEDSGDGLDPITACRIFEPFYTTKSTGMGMGLSICRSIVQSHGGRMWTTPNDGRGARFHFSLPQYHEDDHHSERGVTLLPRRGKP